MHKTQRVISNITSGYISQYMANFIGKFNSVSIPRPSNITKKLNVPRPKVERNQRLEKQRAINFSQCS